VLAERLVRGGGNAVGIAQDIRTLEGANRLMDAAADRFGRVDILVNSAGMRASDAEGRATGGAAGPPIYGGPLLDLTEEAWSFVFQSELSSVFACTKAAATRMAAQGEGGSIITVVGTFLGAPGESAHAAAKSALLAAIWSWSEDLRAQQIRVNGVRGYVRSLLTDPSSFDTDDFDFAGRRGGDQLPTEPADAGELVAWLASNAASDISGTYIGIDGPRVTFWDPRLPDSAVYRYPSWTADELEHIFGPIVRRRPRRPTMVDFLRDLFSARDRAGAAEREQE
jgi:NAD(P)-dependent dehydrogenase (short-subunit alcohol dehydrogenase family)